MTAIRSTFVLLISGCIVATNALTQGLKGSTHLAVDIPTGLVTVTCETSVDLAERSYYQASVSCYVVDGFGNYVASTSAADLDNVGYATAVQSFQGVPGTAYRATSSHNANLVYQSEEPAPLPPHLIGLYYLDRYNLGFYGLNPVYGLYDGQTIADPYSSYTWEGPGPQEASKSSKLHVGSTRDAVVFPIDVVLLIQHAKADWPARCDAVFPHVIEGYTKDKFFQDLMNSPIEQYPAGTPNAPPHDGSTTSDVTIPALHGTIRLFDSFYGTATQHTQDSLREFIIDHEEIHRYSGWSDPQVESKFASSGLVYAEGVSYDITNWLMGSCPPLLH